MKLEGTLETIPLHELIEMVSYSSVTGALNIYATSVNGHLYFRDGTLYHCDIDGSVGQPALVKLFEIGEAAFSFVSDVTCNEESIWGDIEEHIRLAQRLARRWQVIRSRVPSLEQIPVLVVSFEVALRRVGPFHHQVLDRINGQHTLADIVTDLGWTEIDVAEVVAQMIQDRLVDLRTEPATENETHPTVSGPRGSLFGRLLPRSGDTTQPGRVATEELILHAVGR
ncbi:hypothetical protein OSCT_0425 [Oscillochloris trichoides DG-6]|uniref:PatA-like N-terminal domain-containing protein n=1 Tax=Oscillochloris trichoides DG-6 TaxID=765420 RepID=E1IAS4_9CHLR|nr:DUF4388 domain-containing protein [Oscillochloris trichoides]EFO81680.1 hypothetical protein OSCT_0425 [Oscillochloris trichoides DG-6]